MLRSVGCAEPNPHSPDSLSSVAFPTSKYSKLQTPARHVLLPALLGVAGSVALRRHRDAINAGPADAAMRGSMLMCDAPLSSAVLVSHRGRATRKNSTSR